MKTFAIDCKSGISGDMAVGALLDLTNQEDYLRAELAKTSIADEFDINIRKLKKNGILAIKFDVLLEERHHHRNIEDIFQIIESSSIKQSAKTLAKNIFLKLGNAEAKSHKTNLKDIHFHEVGAIDSLIDIISFSILFSPFKIDKIICTKVPTGKGKIKCAHGTFNAPAPATKYLLKGIPTYRANINSELVTPTGAAILKTISPVFCDKLHPHLSPPPLRGRIEEGGFIEIPYNQIETIRYSKNGIGAGARDFKEIPNVLEVFYGFSH